jgi:hypothetical protein
MTCKMPVLLEKDFAHPLYGNPRSERLRYLLPQCRTLHELPIPGKWILRRESLLPAFVPQQEFFGNILPIR